MNNGSITSRIKIQVMKSTFINNGSLSLPTNRLDASIGGIFENNGSYDNIMLDNPIEATANSSPDISSGTRGCPLHQQLREVGFDAYNINGINGNNYFKLRDSAYTLNGTSTQFDVGWDGANNVISLTSGQSYSGANEMGARSSSEKRQWKQRRQL